MDTGLLRSKAHRMAGHEDTILIQPQINNSQKLIFLAFRKAAQQALLRI
jgi:hypothetical protein